MHKQFNKLCKNNFKMNMRSTPDFFTKDYMAKNVGRKSKKTAISNPCIICGIFGQLCDISGHFIIAI